MINPLAEAIEYASSPEHEGAGYALGILFSNDDAVVAEVLANKNGGLRLRELDPDTLAAGNDIFVNPAHVTQVHLIWL